MPEAIIPSDHPAVQALKDRHPTHLSDDQRAEMLREAAQIARRWIGLARSHPRFEVPDHRVENHTMVADRASGEPTRWGAYQPIRNLAALLVEHGAMQYALEQGSATREQAKRDAKRVEEIHARMCADVVDHERIDHRPYGWQVIMGEVS